MRTPAPCKARPRPVICRLTLAFTLQAVRNLLGRCASPDITMHEVPGGAHELFIGLEREAVTSYVAKWIETQLRQDNASEVSERLASSMVLLTGNPFEWRPQGGTPASSIYGAFEL